MPSNREKRGFKNTSTVIGCCPGLEVAPGFEVAPEEELVLATKMCGEKKNRWEWATKKLVGMGQAVLALIPCRFLFH